MTVTKTRLTTDGAQVFMTKLEAELFRKEQLATPGPWAGPMTEKLVSQLKRELGLT